jgi:hypothetical protein
MKIPQAADSHFAVAATRADVPQSWRAVGPMRLLVLSLSLLGALSWSAEKQTAADNKPAAAGSGIYKCRSNDGGLAFVSKIDASLHDCVEIATQAKTAADSSVPMTNRSAETAAPAVENSRHVETQAEHSARVKDMLATVSQWCADNLSPGQKPKDREKAQSACIVDKMGTYKLLYP